MFRPITGLELCDTRTHFPNVEVLQNSAVGLENQILNQGEHPQGEPPLTTKAGKLLNVKKSDKYHMLLDLTTLYTYLAHRENYVNK